MTTLAGAVVAITGAGGGFGQHFIRQCLQAGSQLILTDINVTELESCVAAIRSEVSTGTLLQIISADLSTREGCESFYRSVQKTPDILINNAGIANFGRFDEIPAESWERLMQVNLLAPMRLTSLFIPDMIARRSGHIVNISSMAGWIGSAGLAPYSAAKHGLRGFGEALYDELKPYNIKITAAYPFFSRTPILNSPRFGLLKDRNLPDSMLSAPEDVVKEVLAGVQKDKLHVFPDPTARRLHWIKRLVPGLIPRLERLTSKSR
jgi:short-subunit dehydrogenase